MYRPQFPFCPPPEGMAWYPVIYAFDTTNTPALLVSLASGEETNDIPLLLDSDADFYWCATKMEGNHDLQVRLKIPFTNPLMDDFVPPEVYADSVQPTTFDPLGLFCPKGSAILIALKRP